MIRRSVKDMRHAEFTSLFLDENQLITNKNQFIFIGAASDVAWRQDRIFDPLWTPHYHYVAPGSSLSHWRLKANGS